MADAFDASGLNDPRGPKQLAQAPQNNVSVETLVSPFKAMADAMGYTANKIDETTTGLAQEAGRNAVTRNPDGSVEVMRRPLEFTAGDRAYNAAVMQGALATAQNSITTQYAQIHAKNLNDPQGFKTESDAFIKNLGQQGDPTLRPLLQQHAGQLATQHFDNLTMQKARVDVQSSKAGLESRASDLQNQLLAMARQEGGPTTDDYKKVRGQLDDVYAALGGNQLYGYPPDVLASQKTQFDSKVQAEAVIGDVDRTYNRQGRAQAQAALKTSILDNPKLNLSDSERKTLYGYGLSRLSFLDGEHKAQVDANKQTASALMDGLRHPGHNIPDQMVDDAIGKARQLGDAETALKLDAARMVSRQMAANAGGTDEQRVRSMGAAGGNPVVAPAAAPSGASATPGLLSGTPTARQGANGAPLPAPTQPAPVAGFDRAIPGSAQRVSGSLNDGYRHIPAVGQAFAFFTSRGWSPEQASAITGNLLAESGMNTSIAGDGGVSVAIAQWNGARLTGLKAFAASQGKPWTDLQTQLAYVDHELRTTEAGAGGRLRAARSVEEANAAMIGYERPKGWTLENPAGGHNYSGRLQNSRNIAQANIAGYLPKGDPFAGGASYGNTPYTVAQVQQNPFLVSEFTRAMTSDQTAMVGAASRTGDAIIAGLGRDMLPDPQTVGALLQLSDQYPDKLGGLKEKVVAAIAGWDEGQKALGMPGGQGAQVVEQAKAAAQGAPIMQQKIAEETQATYQRGVNAMKADPLAEGSRRGWYNPVAPMDFGSNGAVIRGVTDRASAAAIRSSRTGTEHSMFSPSEMPGVEASLGAASPQTIATFFSALQSQEPGVVDATLRDPKVVSALKGLTLTDDPQKYKAAMGGLSGLKNRDPRKFADAFGQDSLKDVQGYEVAGQFTTDEGLKKQLQIRQDPASAPAVKDWQQAAEAKFADKAANPKDAARLIASYGKDQPFGSSFGDRAPEDPEATAAMLGDFRALVRDSAVTARGDADKAVQLAAERMSTLYSVSKANNGTYMKLAPERYLLDAQGKPATIGGSFDWIGNQIQDELRERVGPGPGPEFTGGFSEYGVPPTGPAVGPVRYRLMPYTGTQAAVAARQPPPYMLVYEDPKRPGQFQGPVKFTPDVEKAFAAEHERNLARQTDVAARSGRERLRLQTLEDVQARIAGSPPADGQTVAEAAP